MKNKLLGLLALTISSMGLISGVNAACTSDSKGAEVRINHVTSNTQEYCIEVNESFANVQNGDTITLMQPVNIGKEYVKVVSEKATNFTLDLNGQTLSNDALSTLPVLVVNKEGITLTIVDSGKTGKIVQNAATTGVLAQKGTLILEGGTYIRENETKPFPVVQAGAYGGDKDAEYTNKGKLIVKDGTVIEGFYGVMVDGTQNTVDIQGGTINVKNFAVSGNGATTKESTITISGGTLTSTENAGIYHPQSGTLAVKGGDISGKIGIVARGGTINVSDAAKITAKGVGEEIQVGDATDAQVKLSGGVGLIVDNTESYPKATAKITGGEFNTDYAAVELYKDELGDATGTIEVSGGKFNQKVAAKYLKNSTQSVNGVVGTVHNIQMTPTLNGSFSVPSNAAKGETVKVTVTPNAGYQLDKITVTKGEESITVNADNTFVMPDGDVTVKVTFKKVPTKPAEDKNDIIVEEPKGDENVSLSTEASDVLKDSLVNTEDEELKALIKNHDVTIELETEKVTKDSLEKEELEKFEQVIEGANITEFFDLNIVVKAVGQADHYLKNLSKPITLTIDLPELPEVAKGFTRKYYILREHDGVIEKLDATISEDGKTLLFASDKFSKYAIAYVDEEIKDTVTDKNPSTIDSVFGYVTLAITSIGVLGVASKKIIKKLDF